MKKVLIPLLAIPFILASCQSKEEKAAEIIKDELSKTLYDFESYQPIETIVKEAKATVYNDSACWHKGGLLAYGTKQMMENVDKMNEAKEHMEIWGPPSYYSSTYSDNKYYKYKSEYDKAVEDAINSGKVCKRVANDLYEMIENLDTTQVIGWEVTHRFRCKTKGGHSTIGNYRYVIDKDFETIILREDCDDEDEKLRREAIESAQNKYWDSLDI